MLSPKTISGEISRYQALSEQLRQNYAEIDEETLTDTLEGLSGLPDERVRGNEISCGYTARIRIRVRANNVNILREGTGWGWASSHVAGVAYERALKSAETDATKRALATFGSRFGLSLYDKEQNAASRMHVAIRLFAPDGKLLSDDLSPEGFCTGLRQLIEACHSADEVESLAGYNAAVIADLKNLHWL